MSLRLQHWGAGCLLALSMGIAACNNTPNVTALVPEAPAVRQRVDPGAGYTAPVRSGLDRLAAGGFAELKGRKVGLITNHSGLSVDGRHIIDLFVEGGVDVVALFSPEHGIRGEVDTKVDDERDEKTGLTIYSLYGKTQRPTEEMLVGIDTLVFDMQDIGARFYTYIGTMGAAMEEAQKRNIRFIVLDRPNPIRGDWFDGPIQDDKYIGRNTSFRHMPIVHGMTIGEMAEYFNRYSGRLCDGPGIGVDLTVIPLEGWRRDMYFDATGQPWVNPSPNMRSLEEEILYTMVALTEGNKIVSVGRGTDRPFEYLGAPWVDGAALTAAFRERAIPGLWTMQATFIPLAVDVSGRKNYPYQYTGEINHGVRFILNDRDAFNPVVAGIHMLDILRNVCAPKYDFKNLEGNVGAAWVIEALEAREPVDAIVNRWRTSPEFQAFAAARTSVLIY
jgi:uncharacterized protein YbbC (DUF1343 family)